MGRRTWIKFYGEKWLKDGGIIEYDVAVRGTLATLMALICDNKYADSGVLRIRPGCGYPDSVIADLLRIDPRTWASHKTSLHAPRKDDTGLIEVSKFNEISIVGWQDIQPPFRREKPQTVSSSVTSTVSSSASEIAGRGERGEGRGETPRSEIEKKPKDRSPKIDPVAFQEHWNSHPSLKRCRSMTTGRRRQLAIRSGAKDFRENWEAAVDALAKSPWHTGETSGGWRASAKWFLQNDENWLKCLEGEDTAEARREYSKKRVQAQERAVLKRAEDERGKDDISPEAQAFVDNLVGKTGVNDG